MSAMGAEDRIFFCEMRAHPCGDCFLANVRVARAMNESALMAARQLFFRVADDEHGTEEGQKIGWIHRGRREIVSEFAMIISQWPLANDQSQD